VVGKSANSPEGSSSGVDIPVRFKKSCKVGLSGKLFHIGRLQYEWGAHEIIAN